jgi:hypothetical protein
MVSRLQINPSAAVFCGKTKGAARESRPVPSDRVQPGSIARFVSKLTLDKQLGTESRSYRPLQWQNGQCRTNIEFGPFTGADHSSRTELNRAEIDCCRTDHFLKRGARERG